jgi:hypothetical protein
MIQDPIHDDLVSLHDLEDAVRKAGVAEGLREHQRRGGVLLGGLEDEAVAGRHRRRAHPHRDHRGEVERRDPRDHAERLTDRVQVEAGRHLLAERALEQVGQAGRELQELDAALDLGGGVEQALAVLARDDLRDVGLPPVQHLAHPEEQRGAAGERHGPPLRERLPRDLDGAIELLDAREVHLVRLLARRGVVHGAHASRLPGNELAADPVADPFHRPLLPASTRWSSGC